MQLGETKKDYGKGFLTKIVCKKNFKRDLLIFGLVIILAVVALVAERYISEKNRLQEIREQKIVQEEFEQQLRAVFEKENISQISAIQDKINADSWGEYQSNWYGFKLKYPDSWNTPIKKGYQKNSNAEYQFLFFNSNQESKDFVGFKVAVYDVNNTKGLTDTDEFIRKKNIPEDFEQCNLSESYVIETGDYPAEEIYISSEDNCYEKTLFFSITKGQYMYNIIPFLRDGIEFDGDPIVGISDDLPEFFRVASEFENIDIVRPKPKPAKIDAPMPVSYRIDELGRLVCAKKNDKPGKSKKNKHKHLDMQCCLDPDEYPNPHCYYPVEKYGDYL